jgi:arylsulfatase A-like enzyme
MALRLTACALLLCAVAAYAQSDIHLHVVDSLRADRLPTYGYTRATAPRLDWLAERSAVWLEASSTAPWTPSSTASILTGLHPWEHGVRTITTAGDSAVEVIRADVVTLAEQMRRAGYRTVAVVANPWLTAERGYARGFETYRMFARATSGTELVEEVVREVRRTDPRPLFLYVHWLDVHVPWGIGEHAPPAAIAALDLGPTLPQYARVIERPRAIHNATGWNGEPSLARISDAYDRGVRTWDTAFGAYLDALVWDALDRTAIVVTADHGDELYEHGGWTHGHTLYQELLHVPLIVYRPGAGRERRDETVSLVDLAPTVLDVAGLDHGGRTLYEDRGHRTAYAVLESCGDNGGPIRAAAAQYSARRGTRKAITTAKGTRAYDLAADPGEQRPIMGAVPVEVADGLRDYVARGELIGESGRVEMPPDVVERLRVLGYGQ